MELPTDDSPVSLIEGDCLEMVPALRAAGVAAVVSDPPYGIGYDASKSTQQGIQRFAAIRGDDRPFDPSPWLNYPDVTLWGCNNYAHTIPPGEGQWYFWDKVTRNDTDVRIGEGEFAWHKRGTKPRAFRHLWSGAYRASEAGQRSEHPTQKPVELMRWCIRRLNLPPGSLILDPYAGSGTTGIAAAREGMRALLIESDPVHAATARRRVREYMGTGLLAGC